MARDALHGVSLVLVVLALLCTFLSGCSSQLVSGELPGGEGSGKIGATVYRVSDGDTVRVSPEIEGEGAVRLIGVDASETNSSGRDSPEPYAEEARSVTQSSLEGGDLTLEFDAERRDDYGRLLAYVYLPDDTMFNETLLREGYAQVAPSRPTRAT